MVMVMSQAVVGMSSGYSTLMAGQLAKTTVQQPVQTVDRSERYSSRSNGLVAGLNEWVFGNMANGDEHQERPKSQYSETVFQQYFATETPKQVPVMTMQDFSQLRLHRSNPFSVVA